MAWGHREAWRGAAADLGLTISGPVVLDLGESRCEVDLLIEHFGAPKGMAIVSRIESIENYLGELVSAGYGYSVFDAPARGRALPIEDAIELLADWGWSGPQDARPPWMP